MSLEYLLSFKIQKTNGIVRLAKSSFIRLERLAKCTLCKPYQVQKRKESVFPHSPYFHRILSNLALDA